jgi:hypothetical protein
VLQLGVRRLPRRRHGAGDAAARSGDRLVRGARQPLLELARAIAREHEMSMTVDQAGREPAAGAVDHLAGIVPRQVRSRAEPGDPAVLDRERAALDGAVRRPGLGHGGEVDVGQQAVPGRHDDPRFEAPGEASRAACFKTVDRARPYS